MQLRLSPKMKKVDERCRRKHGVDFLEYARRRVNEHATLEEITDELRVPGDPLSKSTLYYWMNKAGLRMQRRMVSMLKEA